MDTGEQQIVLTPFTSSFPAMLVTISSFKPKDDVAFNFTGETTH